LIAAENAAHSHANTLTDPGHLHTYGRAGGSSVGGGGAFGFDTALAVFGNPTTTNTTGITINNASAGAGSAHNNMPLFLLGTLFWKL